LESHLRTRLLNRSARRLALTDIASVPVYAAIDGLSKGSIIRVLPSYILQKINICAIYPSRWYVDAKIRTWIEFLREQLPAAIALDEAVLNGLASSEASAVDRGETNEYQN
jgi:DNA-binding transcriptional LysR family regulator